MKSSAISVMFALAATSAAATHYVSTTGNDTNPGTLAQPWRHIQHACDKSLSGDTVLVETGVYNELVTVKVPMTLQNAPSAKPVIDGTNLPVAASDAALVLINNLRNVTLAGFEIRNYKTTNSTLVPCGILLEGTGNQIVLRGNLVHNIENDGTDPSSINAFGIAVYGNSASGPITNLYVVSNEVRNTKTGSSETVTLNGNVSGFEVLNNLIHDVNNIGIDCIGFEGTSPIPGEDFARNGWVAGNTVYNVTSKNNPAYGGSLGADGIYIDGGFNILIERNIVHQTDIGIEAASEHQGHVAYYDIVRDNLVYLNNVVGISLGGYAASVGGTKDCAFINNTLYQNDTTLSGSGELQIQYNTLDNHIENNIFCASSQGVLYSSATGTGSRVGVSSDYNLFFAPANQSWSWDGNSYSTLSAFHAGTGDDGHSRYGSPLFVNPGGPNFRLQSGSPAINSGNDLGVSIVGAYDLDLRARTRNGTVDMGCYES